MGLASLLGLYGGEVSEAVAFGQQGIAGTPNIWISTITSSFVVRALVERGELEDARALLAALGLTGDLPATWPHNLVRHARGCLHAAAGRPRRSRRGPAEGRGARGAMGNPEPGDPALALRGGAVARARSGTGGPRAGCAPRRSRSPAAGAPAAPWASRCTRPGWLARGADGGIELLTEAVSRAAASPAPLELARALIDLGAAQRRAGARTQAREILREGLDLAHAMGGLALR